MLNFQKKGYSVAEVAQMLHCHPLTCRKKIYAGEIKADVEQRAKRTVIRIPRENLIDYMKRKSHLFDYSLLKSFGIDPDQKYEDKFNAEEEEANREHFEKLAREQEEEESLIHGATAKPTGAWSGLMGGTASVMDVKEPSKISFDNSAIHLREPVKFSFDIEPPASKKTTGMVAIDGRIAVANVSANTAQIIFDAIKNDSKIEFKELKIVLNRR